MRARTAFDVRARVAFKLQDEAPRRTVRSTHDVTAHAWIA